jgi:hypothetical protein
MGTESQFCPQKNYRLNILMKIETRTGFQRLGIQPKVGLQDLLAASFFSRIFSRYT